MKMRIKSILLAVFLVAAVGVGSYILLLSQSKQTKAPVAVPDKSFGWTFPLSATKFPSTGSASDGLAYSDIRDPGGVPQGLPVRLQIPIIGVDSAIEDALITPDGRMDVPAGTVDVAWFAIGPHPGQVGSAVIGGHYGIQDGVPFVFYKLDKINIGDNVYVINDKGDKLTFVVRTISSYDRNADATNVFTSNDGLAHLNLITCEGIWNEVNGNYPRRLVIFTDLVPSTAFTPNTLMFLRSLAIGARGADVVALQSALEQKGFLTMPVGVAMGFFGSLTSVAVAKYQTSENLPSVGVFGPQTRAKLITELNNAPILPRTGAEVGTTSRVWVTISASSQAVVDFLKSLYATPIDGLVTLLLLICIAFMIFKLMRR